MEHVRLDGQRWFDVIAGNENAQAAVMTLPAGETTGGPDNDHAESDQWLYVVDGAGEATVEGRDVALSAGDLVRIDAGETHEIRAGDRALETLNLYVPPEY